MAELEIVGGARSNFVWAVRIAAEEKGVAYKQTSAMPHSPEALACGPTGKIPGMRHGDVALVESKAIISYIDKAFPGKKLIPSKPAAMAEVEQWCSLVTTHFDPVFVRQYILAYAFPGTPDGKPNREKIEASLPAMEKLFGQLETRLTTQKYLAAGKFTAADCLLVPMLVYLSTRFPESGKMIKKFKKLNAYAKRMAKRPSVAKTNPVPPAA